MDTMNFIAMCVGYLALSLVAFILLRQIVIGVAEGVSVTLWKVHVSSAKPSRWKVARVMASTCLSMAINGRAFDALCVGYHEWHGAFDWRFNKARQDSDWQDSRTDSERGAT